MPPYITPKVPAGHLKATQAIRKVLCQDESSAPSSVAVGVLKGGEGVLRCAREGYLEVCGEYVGVDSCHAL